MRQGQLKVGTQIYPYASASGEIGVPRTVTLGGEITAEEVLETMSLPDPETGEEIDFLRLSLPENPTPFDSYLVRKQELGD